MQLYLQSVQSPAGWPSLIPDLSQFAVFILSVLQATCNWILLPPYRVPMGYSKLNVLEEIKAFPGFKFAFPKCYEFKKTGRKNGSLESVTLVLFKIIIKKQSEYYSYLCQC